jgi:hypothetical protein
VRYVSDPISQFDGSTFQSENCVPTSAAVLADIATVGRIRLSGADVRRASGVASHRGLYQSEAADAVVALTHGQVILESQFLEGDGSQRTRLQNRIVAGQAVGLVIDTHVTAGTDFRTGGPTYTFQGLHEVVAASFRLTDGHAEFFIFDPGRRGRGWTWWPASLLYRAAEQGGAGGIWVFAARDTEGVTRQARARGVIRAAPALTAASKGRVVVGRRYFVQATTRGGAWPRGKGTAYGWHKVAAGYIRGDRLA